MTIIKVEMNDSLQERVDGAIEEVENLAIEYLVENKDFDGDLEDLWGAMDYSGGCHEIIDSLCPIYYKDIDALWYLHKDKLLSAYEAMGMGDVNADTLQTYAIYFYIEQAVMDWFHSKEVDNFRGEEGKG